MARTVFPLLPLFLIGAGVVTGVTGLVNALSGAAKIKQAREIGQGAETNYHRAIARTEKAVDSTNAAAAAYGEQQAAARQQVVARMADFIRRNRRQVSVSAGSLLEGVEAETGTVAHYAGTLGSGADWLAGVAKAGLTGTATYTAVPAMVSAYGTASTGTAIASLSGAAGESATAAFLGGGSLAAGGGGMALGGLALNFVTIGPALLVGGLVLNGQGEKALTRAHEYESEVRVAISNQKRLRSVLRVIDTRIQELSQLLNEVVPRAVDALSALEKGTFKTKTHARRFQTAIGWTTAVRDLTSAPIIDENGELNSETGRLLIKYREML
jgi:hypothetical protein